MKKIIFAILFIVICANQSIYGQSVESLIIEAAENNLEIKVLLEEYNAANERPLQVNQLPDPEIGIGGSILPVETRLGPQIARLGVTQMFPWQGVLDGQKQFELAKAKSLYERIGARILDLSFQVKQAYYLLYEIEKSESIIKQNVIILESLKQLALTKVESGKGTAADVLRVQLKIEEMNQEIRLLETSKAKPIITINQLLNRALDIPIITSDSLSFAIIPYDKTAILESIETHHPTLRMYELQQDISNQAMVLNKLNGKPSFGVGLDYILVNDRSDAEVFRNGRDALQLRASIKIPLYRQKYTAKEREEQFKIAALENKKSDVLSRFTASIEKAYVDYETAQLWLSLYLKQIDITQATINILETDYSAKGNNFDELLRMEKELIDYDLKILKVIVQSHLAKSSIERYVDG